MNNSNKYLREEREEEGNGIGEGREIKDEEYSGIVNEKMVGKGLKSTVGFKDCTRSTLFFENLSEWLTTVETAAYLRKYDSFGSPSVNAIHKLVSKGKIRRRKFSGRLYFKKIELDYLIESSGP